MKGEKPSIHIYLLIIKCGSFRTQNLQQNAETKDLQVAEVGMCQFLSHLKAQVWYDESRKA